MRRLLVIAALLISTRTARAELWTSSMGDLLHGATEIEIVDVKAVSRGTLDGILAVAIRSGQKPGDRVHLPLGTLPPPAAGDRVLIVCDGECPRAIGVERNGAFGLIAQEPMDGAFVTPNLVEERSLAALAAGKPAPALCMRGTVELLDDAARPGFEIRVRATDGAGKGELGGRAVRGSLGVVWFASEAGAIAITLSDRGDLALVADHVTRANDGCYDAALAPSAPLARTRRGLDRALDGKATAIAIARGTLTVAKGAPVAAGSHALAFNVRDDGQLELASDLATGQVSHVQYDAGHFGVGFPGSTAGSPNDPELYFDFGVTMSEGPEHGAAVARALHDGAKAQVTWIHGGTRTAIGTATFTYLPEK